MGNIVSKVLRIGSTILSMIQTWQSFSFQSIKIMNNGCWLWLIFFRDLSTIMIHAMLGRMNSYRGFKILRVLWMILKQKKGPRKKIQVVSSFEWRCNPTTEEFLQLRCIYLSVLLSHFKTSTCKIWSIHHPIFLKPYGGFNCQM